MLINRILVCMVFLGLMGGCASQNEKEPRTCPVHQIPMSRELVVLRNGVSSWEYQEARNKYFPFSGTVYTDHVLPSTQQQISQADICPECRKTELKWFQGEFKALESEVENREPAVDEQPEAVIPARE